MYFDDEGSVSSNSEKQQPLASRVADNLPSTGFSNHKITEGKLNDLIRDLKLPKRRQIFWHQSYNSGIYYATLPLHINTLNAELNPICYLLALLGAHHFLHVSRVRVKSLIFRLLMSYIYIYGVPILDVSRSHTTTQHIR